MKEHDIQKALWKKYDHHKYRFLNTYFFGSEQDYLTFLQGGYCWELEIKTSRSDFRADFKKKKHKLYSKILDNVKFKCIAVRNIWIEKEIEFDPSNETHRQRTRYIRNERTEVTEQWSRSDIQFQKVSEIDSPNRFYYAVPLGLVKASEVPVYAGLIYVTETGKVIVEKKAPLLHKEKIDHKRSFNTVYWKYHHVQWTVLFGKDY